MDLRSTARFKHASTYAHTTAPFTGAITTNVQGFETTMGSQHPSTSADAADTVTVAITTTVHGFETTVGSQLPSSSADATTAVTEVATTTVHGFETTVGSQLPSSSAVTEAATTTVHDLRTEWHGHGLQRTTTTETSRRTKVRRPPPTTTETVYESTSYGPSMYGPAYLYKYIYKDGLSDGAKGYWIEHKGKYVQGIQRDEIYLTVIRQTTTTVDTKFGTTEPTIPRTSRFNVTKYGPLISGPGFLYRFLPDPPDSHYKGHWVKYMDDTRTSRSFPPGFNPQSSPHPDHGFEKVFGGKDVPENHYFGVGTHKYPGPRRIPFLRTHHFHNIYKSGRQNTRDKTIRHIPTSGHQTDAGYIPGYYDYGPHQNTEDAPVQHILTSSHHLDAGNILGYEGYGPRAIKYYYNMNPNLQHIPTTSRHPDPANIPGYNDYAPRQPDEDGPIQLMSTSRYHLDPANIPGYDDYSQRQTNGDSSIDGRSTSRFYPDPVNIPGYKDYYPH